MSIILIIISVFVAAFAQIMLKVGASKLNIYINRYTIIGYFLMIISAYFSYLGLINVDVSISGVLESLNYFFVPLLSFIFFKEKTNRKSIFGISLIIIGIIIYCIY